MINEKANFSLNESGTFVLKGMTEHESEIVKTTMFGMVELLGMKDFCYIEKRETSPDSYQVKFRYTGNEELLKKWHELNKFEKK